MLFIIKYIQGTKLGQEAQKYHFLKDKANVVELACTYSKTFIRHCLSMTLVPKLAKYGSCRPFLEN